MIPGIIHQTWKTREVPARWRLAVDSWRRYHPDWEYRLWTNEDGYAFVEEFYPDFSPVYCGYPYDIQRADVIRYLVVHHYGGLYADMDYECLRTFDPLLEGRHFVIGTEPAGHFADFGGKSILCNALFAAEPGAPFLGQLIDALRKDESRAVAMRDVLTTTGPLMMQQVYEQYRGDDLEICPPELLCPLSHRSTALQQLASNGPKREQVRQLLIEHGAYAVHYWSNSWTDNISSTPLVNPHPDAIPGFTFYPGLDSVGHDRFNGGRDIPQLAEHCMQEASIVAFNTDGFAKHKLLPREDWTQRENPDGKYGLYVKTGINIPVK